MLSPYPIILDLIWVVLLLPHIPQIQLINFEKQKKGKEKTNLVQVWCTCFALDKAPNHTYMFFFPLWLGYLVWKVLTITIAIHMIDSQYTIINFMILVVIS